jgi:hypothetical protein
MHASDCWLYRHSAGSDSTPGPPFSSERRRGGSPFSRRDATPWDRRGAARRQPIGEEPGGEERRCGNGQDQRVVRRCTEQQRRQEPACADRAADPDGQAERDARDAAVQHRARNVAAAGAQRDPDTQLARALRA